MIQRFVASKQKITPRIQQSSSLARLSSISLLAGRKYGSVFPSFFCVPKFAVACSILFGDAGSLFCRARGWALLLFCSMGSGAANIELKRFEWRTCLLNRSLSESRLGWVAGNALHCIAGCFSLLCFFLAIFGCPC